MKTIATGLGDPIHTTATPAPQFGTLGVGRDAELLHHFDKAPDSGACAKNLVAESFNLLNCRIQNLSWLSEPLGAVRKTIKHILINKLSA